MGLRRVSALESFECALRCRVLLSECVVCDLQGGELGMFSASVLGVFFNFDGQLGSRPLDFGLCELELLR